MRQPKSVITCLAYILAGGLVVAGGLPMQGYVGIMIIFLGIASAGFHWTLKRGWQKADEIGMLLTFSAIMFLQLSIIPGAAPYLIVASIILGTSLAVTHDRWGNDTIGLLALIVLLVSPIRIGFIQPLLALAMFLGALKLQRMGGEALKNKRKGRHDNLHAAWHIITALAIYIISI